MTAWIISQTNRFKAASLGAGMSDLVSFYGQTDISGFLEFYFGGVPWKALDLYNRLSPIAHAANIKTPTLILTARKISVSPCRRPRNCASRSGGTAFPSRCLFIRVRDMSSLNRNSWKTWPIATLIRWPMD